MLEIITCNNNEIKINSYIIKNNNKAIVIDPNNFDEIDEILNGYELDYILLTHEHFDHIMAVDKIRDKYNAKVIAQKYTNENIQSSSKNLSKFSNIILDFMNVKINSSIKEFSVAPADITYEDSFELIWEDIKILFIHTPGHSQGSSCILVDNYIFTGDSLFEFCKTDTKGIGCSKKDYENITLQFFKSLKKDYHVFSGHYNPFILDDKINAKQRAIDIFKRRPKLTNCYVTYTEFLNLIENHIFFIRKNSIFILKEDENNFFRFYYYTDDYKNLKNLEKFFNMYKKPIVLEVISNTFIEEKYYLANNFVNYKIFSRYATTDSGKKYDSVKHAKDNDINDIKKLIDSNFDPLTDYIPTYKELSILILKNEVFIIRIKNILAGVAIFQKNGNAYHFRLSCVHENFRPGIIGYMLAKSSPNEGHRCIAWVDDENTEAKKLNSALGYTLDGIKNYIFVRY